MRRLHLIFAIVVVTAFVSAFLAERSRPAEPVAEPLPALPSVELPPLVLNRGVHAVQGTVVDHAGELAPEVTVQATPLAALPPEDATAAEPFFFAHTDARGRFELTHLPAGRYTVLLVSPGVRNTTAEMVVPAAAPISLRLNEPYGDLPPAPDPIYVTLSGTLRRPPALAGTGADLEGLEVLLLPRDDEARWRGAMERRAPVDSSGRFRVEELAVANHVIAVLPAWARGGTWPYLVERDLSAEEIGPGASGEGADAVELELAVGELAGRLFDARGRPVEGALLRVHAVGDELDRAWPAISTDPEGRFHVRDLPATEAVALYEISVFAGAARQEMQAEVRRGAQREVRFGPLDTRSESE